MLMGTGIAFSPPQLKATSKSTLTLDLGSQSLGMAGVELATLLFDGHTEQLELFP